MRPESTKVFSGNFSTLIKYSNKLFQELGAYPSSNSLIIDSYSKLCININSFYKR